MCSKKKGWTGRKSGLRAAKLAISLSGRTVPSSYDLHFMCLLLSRLSKEEEDCRTGIFLSFIWPRVVWFE